MNVKGNVGDCQPKTQKPQQQALGRKPKTEAGIEDGVKCKYASGHNVRRAFGLGGVLA